MYAYYIVTRSRARCPGPSSLRSVVVWSTSSSTSRSRRRHEATTPLNARAFGPGSSTSRKGSSSRNRHKLTSGVDVAEEPYIQEEPEEERFPSILNAPRYDWRQKAISQLNSEDFHRWKQTRSQVRWVWPSIEDPDVEARKPLYKESQVYAKRYEHVPISGLFVSFNSVDSPP